MKIPFRLGIARRQRDVLGTDAFLVKRVDSNSIDLMVSPDPTVIVFAHRTANYVFEETKTVLNAWGPFTGAGTYWLYWDINLLTALVTRGFTQVMPVFSSGQPSNPPTDLHWFDTVNYQMKVWNGSKWVDKVRVFAATFTTPSHITPYPLGSNYTTPAVDIDAGNILLDTYNKPIRQSDGTFLTSATALSTIGYSIQKVKYETALLQLMADENIPAFSAVRVQSGRLARLARNTDYSSRVIGVMTEDLFVGEVGNVIPAGLVRSVHFNWPAEVVGMPFFCGETGQLTVTPNASGILQQVGYIYDTDAVYVDVKAPIILDDITGSLPPELPPPPGAPIANFQAVPFTTSGDAPFTVTFQSTSLNSPTAYEWDFTNDGTIDATTPTATHTYTQAGTYSVRLRVTNAFGDGVEVKTGYITVAGAQSTGIYTNLEAVLTAPAQVVIGQAFTVSLLTKNDGAKTATMVARKVEVDDVGASPVAVSGLPPGASLNRIGKKMIVTFPLIASMVTQGQVLASFTVQAPATGALINIRASVSSPEQDIESRDNADAVAIQMRQA